MQINDSARRYRESLCVLNMLSQKQLNVWDVLTQSVTEIEDCRKETWDEIKTPLCSSWSHLLRVCLTCMWVCVCMSVWVYLHTVNVIPLLIFHIVATHPIWLSFILPHSYLTSLLHISHVFLCDSFPQCNYREYYACASVSLSSSLPAEYYTSLETDIHNFYWKDRPIEASAKEQLIRFWCELDLGFSKLCCRS